jgi:hypothetical protein
MRFYSDGDSDGLTKTWQPECNQDVATLDHRKATMCSVEGAVSQAYQATA